MDAQYGHGGLRWDKVQHLSNSLLIRPIAVHQPMQSLPGHELTQVCQHAPWVCLVHLHTKHAYVQGGANTPSGAQSWLRHTPRLAQNHRHAQRRGLLCSPGPTKRNPDDHHQMDYSSHDSFLQPLQRQNWNDEAVECQTPLVKQSGLD